MIESYLNNRFFILYLFPFILGSLTVFSFQPFNFTLINFIILPIFLYLIAYINRKSKSKYRKKPFKKNFFIFGSTFGFGFYLCGLYWITNSLTFDENFKILIPFGLVLIPLFLSLFFSIVTVLTGPYISLNFKSIIILSGALALSDYIRSKVLTGFPWNLWAYSFSWSTEIIQILNKIGLFAFNLITITFFLLPAVFFLKIKISQKSSIIFFVTLIILSLYIYGNYSINQNSRMLNGINDKFHIKVISPNFNLNYNLSYQEIESRLKKLIKYSEPKKNKKTIFVWPEGVFSGYSYNEILGFRKIFLNSFSENHLIIFGVNRSNLNGDGLFNSLLIVNNRFEIIKEYKKQKLVPFGEFLPFENTLQKIGLKKITEGYGSFLKGRDQNNLIVGKLSILPLICYEIIFPKLIQKNRQNSNLIINISEDGWFGKSIGPYQHFSKAVFRAVEHNSFLIRSANKGISAIINNKGEIIKKLSPSEAGNIELEVPLIKSNKKNKNDLIFIILLFTYIFFLKFYNNVKK